MKLFGQVLGQPLVPIETSQANFTVRGDRAVFPSGDDLDESAIECAPAQVEYKNRFVVFLIETVSQGSGCRLVDDTKNLETCDSSSILGSLTLSVVKVYER